MASPLRERRAAKISADLVGVVQAEEEVAFVTAAVAVGIAMVLALATKLGTAPKLPPLGSAVMALELLLLLTERSLGTNSSPGSGVTFSSRSLVTIS